MYRAAYGGNNTKCMSCQDEKTGQLFPTAHLGPTGVPALPFPWGPISQTFVLPQKLIFNYRPTPSCHLVGLILYWESFMYWLFSRSELIHPINVPFFIPRPIQLLPIFIWNRSTRFALRYSAYLIMLFNQWKLAGIQTNLKQKQNWKLPENFQFWDVRKLWIWWHHALHIQVYETHHGESKLFNKKTRKVENWKTEQDRKCPHQNIYI